MNTRLRISLAFFSLALLISSGPAWGQYQIGNNNAFVPLVQPLPAGAFVPIDPDVGPLANPIFYSPSLGMTFEQRPIGMRVVSTDFNGAGLQMGFRPGDRILAVNNRVLQSPADLYQAVAEKQGPAELVIRRFGSDQPQRSMSPLPLDQEEAAAIEQLQAAQQEFTRQQNEMARQSVVSRGQSRVFVGDSQNMDLSGAWNSNFGPLMLKQEGTRVTGEMTLNASTGLPQGVGFTQSNGTPLAIDTQLRTGSLQNTSRRATIEGEIEGNQFHFRWAAADGSGGDGRGIISASGSRIFGTYENTQTNTVFNLNLSR